MVGSQAADAGKGTYERKTIPMWERMKEKRAEGGFTLIELLIVIIILAILAAIVVFAVGSTSKNSIVASCKADAKSVETATEAFKAQTGTWPGGAGAWATATENAAGKDASVVLTQSWGTQPATTYYTGPLNTDTITAANPVGPWMRTFPNTDHYTISVSSADGKVFVDTGKATADSNFDTSSPNVCEGAGT